MRIVRFSQANGVAFGAVDGESQSMDDLVVAQIAGHPFGEIQFTGDRYPLADVRLLAPMLPSKVVCVGKNYAEHAREMGGEPPAEPVLFLKPSTSVIGPGEPIRYPAISEQVDYEGELAVIVGRLCKDVPIERAGEVIFGYACANDVTARDLQRSDGQWTRAKGFDTFCPLGPWIETTLEPGSLRLTTAVNGEVRQSGNTADLITGIHELIVYISRVMTLLPGDVILTGTPAGVGPIRPGEVVSVSIESLGTLTNPVVDDD